MTLMQGARTHQLTLILMGIAALVMARYLIAIANYGKPKICRPGDFPKKCEAFEQMLERKYGQPTPRKPQYLRPTLEGFGITKLSVLTSCAFPDGEGQSFCRREALLPSGEEICQFLDQMLKSKENCAVGDEETRCQPNIEIMVYGDMDLHAFHVCAAFSYMSNGNIVQNVERHFYGEQLFKMMRGFNRKAF